MKIMGGLMCPVLLNKKLKNIMRLFNINILLGRKKCVRLLKGLRKEDKIEGIVFNIKICFKESKTKENKWLKEIKTCKVS